MEEVVLVLGLVLALVGTVEAAQRSRRHGAPGALGQLGAGLLCGAAGATAAAVPYSDVLPDTAEPVLLAVLVPLTAVTVAGATARRARRRRRPSPPGRGGDGSLRAASERAAPHAPGDQRGPALGACERGARGPAISLSNPPHRR